MNQCASATAPFFERGSPRNIWRVPKWLPRFGRSSSASAAKRSQVSSGQDELALAQLVNAGGDASSPTEIWFYVYFPTEAAARTAERELAPVGVHCEVRPAAKGSTWLVLARITALPTAANVEAESERFQALAERLGGEYDGWEAAVRD